MRRSDSSPPIPDPFVLSGRTLSPGCLVRSARLPIRVCGCREAWPVHRRAHTLVSKEAERPPRFLVNSCAHAPLYDPGRISRPDHAAARCCLPRTKWRRLLREFTFEAQSRGLCARCVHFTSPVARRRTTLASGWRSALAGRDSYPQSCSRDFGFYILPSLPGLSWRTWCMNRS